MVSLERYMLDHLKFKIRNHLSSKMKRKVEILKNLTHLNYFHRFH